MLMIINEYSNLIRNLLYLLGVTLKLHFYHTFFFADKILKNCFNFVYLMSFPMFSHKIRYEVAFNFNLIKKKFLLVGGCDF